MSNKKRVLFSFIICLIFSICIAYNIFFIIPFFISILFIKYKTKFNPSNIIAKTFSLLMLIIYPIKFYFFGLESFPLFSEKEILFKLDAVTIYFLRTFFIQFVAIAFFILCIKDDIKYAKKSWYLNQLFHFILIIRSYYCYYSFHLIGSFLDVLVF